MGAECSAQGEDGLEKRNGFSVMDIVKHSLKTLIKTLRPQDRLALVVFDHEVEILFTLSEMTEQGQLMATEITNTIVDNGQTNIYHALVQALEIIEKRDDNRRNPAIMLFTDGVPNVSPPRGEVDALKRILTKKNHTCPIHTFGFGYDLNSNLLYDIAKATNGMMGFIPDASFIGTILINAIANVMSTAAIDTKLKLEFQKDSKIKNMFVGDFNGKKSSKDTEVLEIDIGSIKFG